MSDQLDTPLTDEERAELEALRAEKARRERAELEALRAEREAVEAVPAPAPAPQAAAPVTDPQSSLQSQPSATPAPVSAASDPDPAKADTFGRRMVLSQGEDEDGIPAMPPAQKILIAICLIAALGAAAYVVLNNLGML